MRRDTSRALPPPLVSCRAVVALLGDLVDGELERRGQLAVHEHLRRCATCAAYLESYRATDFLVRWAFEAPSRT